MNKSRQCSALAAVLEKSGKDINTSLPELPSAQELESKASLFRALSSDVKALQFSEKALAKQREELAEQLSVIEKELGNAAKARKELDPASNVSSSDDDTVKTDADDVDTNAASTDVARRNSAAVQIAKKANAPPSKELSQAASAKRKSEKSSMTLEQIRKRGPSPKMNNARRHEEAVKRRYSQAARAIDASHTQIKVIVKRIGDLCRD